jgi:hypothetical protein
MFEEDRQISEMLSSFARAATEERALGGAKVLERPVHEKP